MKTEHIQLLERIKKHLASQSVETTLRQLHECRCDGPSINEFLGLNKTENKSEAINILGIS
jgi:hypothetical protein